MTTVTTMNAALPAGHRGRLVQFAQQVTFEAGARLFGEGRRADPFWIVRTGAVALDLHEPGRRPAAVGMLRHGELVGLSWHFAPRMGHLGAEAVRPVRTWESDAEAARAVCAEDPEFASPSRSGSGSPSPSGCTDRAPGCSTSTPHRAIVVRHDRRTPTSAFQGGEHGHQPPPCE
ncbi:cyclic nucleotide-binding domain-containing protein [Streptomyces sp. NPDC059262]|uniref:cyclic nucleotide-binding domain-containing protein n=1 Tax=Streptomyces sp. NPDC059262 TaxID=3346797 RepID=UPI0036C3E86C